jgi:hypothetical protein
MQKEGADLLTQFPVDFRRYAVIFDVMRDRYGITGRMDAASTLVPATHFSMHALP